jgi:hypothetical protein
MDWSANADTLTVQAGDELQMDINVQAPNDYVDENFYGCPNGRGSCHFYNVSTTSSQIT